MSKMTHEQATKLLDKTPPNLFTWDVSAAVDRILDCGGIGDDIARVAAFLRDWADALENSDDA